MPETASIFVSSTWVDLQTERAAVEDAIDRLREAKFIGMEHFGSRAETANDASLEEVDRSNVYVGIFGSRYGSGITEAEYRRARERGLACFIYLAEGVKRTEDPQLAPLVRDLRANHITKEFANPDNLAALVTADLHRWLFEDFLGPKLNAAVEGSYSRSEARALLDEVRDLDQLDPELRKRLGDAGILVTGDLHIGNRYFSLVSTRTLVVAFALFLALGSGIAGAYWYTTQPDPPRVLDGDFNVAIADFGEVGPDGKIVASQRGTQISVLLYESLAREGGLSNVFSKVDFERNKVGLIKDEEEATRRAKEMNAHLVIWGTVGGDQVLPRMLVFFDATNEGGTSFTLREMQGNYAARLSVDSATDSLDARTDALLRFIEGLVQLQAGDYERAAASFERAGRSADDGRGDGEPSGAEVYYMWAAEAARQMSPPALERAQQNIELAIDRNVNYGRAYLVQGNIYMARAAAIDNNRAPLERLDFVVAAHGAYALATAPENEVRGRNVDLRGQVGMGNALFLMAQDAGNDPLVMRLAEAAYARVVASGEPGDQTWDIVFAAHLNLGRLWCRLGNSEAGLAEYVAARELETQFDEVPDGQSRIPAEGCAGADAGSFSSAVRDATAPTPTPISPHEASASKFFPIASISLDERQNPIFEQRQIKFLCVVAQEGSDRMIRVLEFGAGTSREIISPVRLRDLRLDVCDAGFEVLGPPGLRVLSLEVLVDGVWHEIGGTGAVADWGVAWYVVACPEPACPSPTPSSDPRTVTATAFVPTVSPSETVTPPPAEDPATATAVATQPPTATPFTNFVTPTVAPPTITPTPIVNVVTPTHASTPTPTITPTQVVSFVTPSPTPVP